MTKLEVELLAALGGLLAEDGHDARCPKHRVSADRACSLRCTNARNAVGAAREQLLAEARERKRSA